MNMECSLFLSKHQTSERPAAFSELEKEPASREPDLLQESVG